MIPIEPPVECDYLFSLSSTEGACELFDVPIELKKESFKPRVVLSRKKKAT
jgi:hypothetical protein